METIKINKLLRQWGYGLLPLIVSGFSCNQALLAQENLKPETPSIAQDRPPIRQPDRFPFPPPTPPSQEFPTMPLPQPLPQPPLEEDLPPPDEQIPQPPEPLIPGEIPATIRVNRFDIVGSTIFSPEELAAVIEDFAGQDLTFAELLQVRSIITQYYVDRGYITSGAVIPPQRIEEGVVIIQVVEGRLEDIDVAGTRRLNSGYIRSRLRLAGATPLNVDRLLEGLQLLQLDPLIDTISADLQAGVQPGTSVLQVQVTEADTFRMDLSIDNNRSPSVGSFQRQVQLNQANLTGLGDGLIFSYANTDGSNQLSGSYTVPINPRNGTLQLSVGYTDSNIIEPPFDRLDISAASRYYELVLRQPLFQSPTEEFALALIVSRQESDTRLLDLPFPLSAGANDQGETRLSAIRFVQEWVNRSSTDVVAVRSQFSLGLDLLNATINHNAPDSRFFAWRGQSQWVHLLAPDTLLLIRGDIQIADSPLLPLEQFGIGGAQTVRGYRQDFLLTDSGVQASAEIRLPVLRVDEINGVLQVIPFFDFGAAWNADGVNPEPSALFGMGAGLLWQQGDNLSVSLSFGVPLVSVDSRTRTWQESGVYFSVRYSPF